MDAKKIKDLTVGVSVLAIAAAVWYAAIRLDREVSALRVEASETIQSVDERADSLQDSLTGTLQEARSTLAQANRTIASYEGRSQAWEALAQREVAALRGQLVWAQLMEVRPVRDSLVSAIDGHAKLAAEIRAQAEDLYWDVKAGVESGTVAARGVAEASEATGKAMPRIAASAEIVASEAARVAPQVATDAQATMRNVRRATGWPALVFGAVKKVGCKIPPVSFVPGCD